jgi:hypothetical protein
LIAVRISLLVDGNIDFLGRQLLDCRPIVGPLTMFSLYQQESNNGILIGFDYAWYKKNYRTLRNDLLVNLIPVVSLCLILLSTVLGLPKDLYQLKTISWVRLPLSVLET